MAFGILGHGVDGEITPPEILLERDFRGGMKDESFVARGYFALGACKCIFFVGLWVQKDREVFTDLDITSIFQILGRRPNHHPIPIHDRTAQEFVADGAPNLIDLHPRRARLRKRL
jgi:hypothetical protein